VVLEKLAEIESQDSKEEQFSWLESEGEETEVQKRKKKGKTERGEDRQNGEGRS